MVQAKSVRLGFTKTGRLQFISHLDLARTMSRVIVRAGVPIWYTEGFNPRPKLVFALPLSIGTESVTEFVDFKITEDMSNEEIACRVAAEFAPEMKVNGVWYPERKFTELMYAVYDIEIHSGKICDGISREVGKMFTSPLMVMKRSKSGEKEVDLSSMIKKMTVKDTGKVLKITATLPCDSANYLNPEYIVKAIAEKLDIDFNKVETEYYSIMRCGAKLADGETDFR